MEKKGDEVKFDFAFFAPSGVIAFDSESLTGVLSGTKTFHLSLRTQ